MERQMKRQMKRMIKFFIAAFFVCGLLLGAVLGYGWKLFNDQGPLEAEKTLILKSGTGLAAISVLLETAGIINDRYAFILGVRLKKKTAALKAGEYKFAVRSTGQDVMDLLVSGRTVIHKITVPEGYTSREISEMVRRAYGLDGEITITADEGSLLPETYYYKYGDRRDQLLQRMQLNMTRLIDDLWRRRKNGDLIKSKKELVTLASIVEKETALAAERPHVAAVFRNRLQKKMRLQSDPTVIYGVTMGKARLGRPISKSDLADKNGYNTYKISALPLGPICNPGRASLEAVLAPIESDSLYFVANGKGGHVFARTLAAHNRNVRRWRKLQKQKK